jgi:hypothetical protein
MSHRDGRRRSSAERIPAALSEAAPSTRTEEIVHARLGMREALAAIALGDERSAPDALFALLRRLGRLVRFAPVLRDAPTARVQSTHVSSVKVSPKAFQLSRLFFPDDSTRRVYEGRDRGGAPPSRELRHSQSPLVIPFRVLTRTRQRPMPAARAGFDIAAIGENAATLLCAGRERLPPEEAHDASATCTRGTVRLPCSSAGGIRSRQGA